MLGPLQLARVPLEQVSIFTAALDVRARRRRYLGCANKILQMARALQSVQHACVKRFAPVVPPYCDRVCALLGPTDRGVCGDP